MKTRWEKNEAIAYSKWRWDDFFWSQEDWFLTYGICSHQPAWLKKKNTFRDEKALHTGSLTRDPIMNGGISIHSSRSARWPTAMHARAAVWWWRIISACQNFQFFFLFMIYSSHFYHQVFHGDHCGFPAKSFFSSGDSPLISTLSFSKFFFFFPVVVLHWQLARQLTLPRKAQQSSRLSRRRHAFLRPRPRPPPAAPPPRRRRRRRCAGGAGGGGGGHLQGVAGAVHPHRHAPPAARPRCPLHW